MLDYADWLGRAERFVRGTSALPGEWSMEVAVEPPLSPYAADQLAKTLPHGLPQPLLNFYLTASASAECHFSWTPVGKQLAKLQKVIDNNGIYGGARLCPAMELAEHYSDMLAWEDNFRDGGGYGPAAALVLCECVPLISVENGDYVALHVKAAAGAPNVVYVSHDSDCSEASPIVPLARELDEFLSTWEKLGYLGPEIWLLGAFLEDSTTGLLDPNSKLARKWQALMTTFGFPTTL